jgi:hypothetical protein
MDYDGAGARELGGAGNNRESSGAVDQQHEGWKHVVSDEKRKTQSGCTTVEQP